MFLDDEDYTPTLDADVIGDDAGYHRRRLTGIYVQVIDEQPVAIQLPASVVLEVIETPELKGGTATKRPKPAKLNTGIEIMVPEYIVNGERVLVNTATGEFAAAPTSTFADRQPVLPAASSPQAARASDAAAV